MKRSITTSIDDLGSLKEGRGGGRVFVDGDTLAKERGARSRGQLACASGISVETIKRLENSHEPCQVNRATRRRLELALELGDGRLAPASLAPANGISSTLEIKAQPSTSAGTLNGHGRFNGPLTDVLASLIGSYREDDASLVFSEIERAFPKDDFCTNWHDLADRLEVGALRVNFSVNAQPLLRPLRTSSTKRGGLQER